MKEFIAKIPLMRTFMSFCGKTMRQLVWKIRVEYRSKRLGLLVDEIYWVDPNEIVFCTLIEFNPYKYIGIVKDGDWDKRDIKFEDLDIFQAMEKRYFKNAEWKSTEFYKNTLKRINDGEILWGCSSEKDLIVRCQKIDRLFYDIRENGYKSQLELNGIKLKHLIENADEISVNIDRNGRMLFNNSAHRLVIAKLLNVKKIPIIIIVRHLSSLDGKRNYT